jgi:hypothetical protein
VYIVSHVLGEGYSVRACLAGAHILAKSFSQEPSRCLMVSSSLQWHMGSRDLPDLLALLAVQIILLSQSCFFCFRRKQRECEDLVGSEKGGYLRKHDTISLVCG